MKKTVELNQRLIVLEAECNSVLCSFSFAPCRIEEIHRCQKTPVLFFTIILDYSVKYSLCNLCEVFNDTILTNRLEVTTEKEKYIAFCRCHQSVCVSCCCCCCFAEYIKEMCLVHAARAARLFFCLFGPLISLNFDVSVEEYGLVC